MVQRFINDMKKNWNYAFYSAQSVLQTEVANSYLNWLWWIFDPICFMVIYTFIFGVVFNGKEQYFPVFIFIGLSMWDFFNRNINSSVLMVKNNKPIVTKVYLPKFVLILTRMFVNGFKMLISFGIVAVMMVVYQVPINKSYLYAVPILIVLFVFTFGCCTHLLHFGVFVEDLSNVTQILLRLLFYLTGIFYSVEKRVPEPFNEYIAKWNPLAFLLNAMRRALLEGKRPDLFMLLIWFIISLVITAFGIRKIYKNENSYVKVI